MSKGWQEEYSKLTDFIVEHSEVEIGLSRVKIPKDVRPELYRLFDAVRTAFIEEKFYNLLNEATPLIQNYLKAEQEVMKLLDLDNISMVTSLVRFLRDPIDQLMRGLFDPLFDLLKGRIDIETFEKRSSQNIQASFWPLYRLGYEKWVVLSLVKLLEADKSFHVTFPEASLYDAHRTGGFLEESVSNPEESRSILFKYAQNDALMVPDLIVHSAKLNRYIATRSQIVQPFGIATDTSEKREWYSLDSIKALEPDLTLVYMDDNPEEISLVGDKKKICRPDLIIECREQKDWFEKERLERVKLRHDSLKPTLGTYTVSMELVPEQAYKKLMPEQFSKKGSISEQERKPTREKEPEKQEMDINILSVGFDQSKLEPIINALTQA